jgi:hypothetical protein
MSMHHGSCHCGAVSFNADLDLSKPAVICNCSMCGRAGTMLSFITPDKFTLEKGEDSLTSYEFNKHVIDHLFCKVCGVKPFARGKGKVGDMVAINVRCLDGIDVFKVVAEAKQVDGKSV